MKRLGLVIAATVIITATASAHHSPAAFDMNSQITIQGTVSRLDWTNPHVYIHVKGQSASGRSTEWIIETDPVPILNRSGWRRELLAVGSPVTVRAHPDRNPQRNHALLLSIALRDGGRINPAVRRDNECGQSHQRGRRLEWSSRIRPAADRRGEANDKGPGRDAGLHRASNSVGNCVPYATPWLPALPYLNEIEIGKDRVVIRSEFLNVDRTVYLDGRPHPRGAMRTIQGHSIGRWEGDVLVVDTALFADHLLGNYVVSRSVVAELPSGPRKHVVERYQLSDDRTRLLLSVVVEDPDYLAEPLTVSTTWDYAPQQRLLRFACDRKQSRRYLFH